jgi:membrane protease YdiL (CAAX protease family)
MNADDDRPLIPELPEAAEPEARSAGALFEGDPPEEPLSAPRQEYLPEDLRVPWGWFELLIFVLVCFAAGVFLIILAAIGFYLLSRGRPEIAKSLSENLIVDILFMVALDFAVVGYLAAQIRLQFNEPFWRTIGWHALDVGAIPRGVVVLGLICTGLFLDLVVTLASAIEPPKKELPIDKLFQDPHSALLFMLVAVALAPAVEEMVFRGYIYPVIARSWGIAWGVIATGVLFGGLHAQQLWGGPWQIASLVFVGIALTFVRAKTRTVLASFIVHTSYNSFQVLLVLIGTHGLRHLPSIH